MSHGIQIYNSGGSLSYSTDDISFCMIGMYTFSFNSNEFGSKSVTIPGLLDTDYLLISDNGPLLFGVVLTRAGQLVTVNRTSSLAGLPSTHYVVGFRKA
jgi:hypothetical protein